MERRIKISKFYDFNVVGIVQIFYQLLTVTTVSDKKFQVPYDENVQFFNTAGPPPSGFSRISAIAKKLIVTLLDKKWVYCDSSRQKEELIEILAVLSMLI